MECFIHNMLAKEMTLSTEREEEKLFTDTNENWTLKRTKQEQKLCMIKNCWRHDERLIYWILKDYTDDVYQLSLASRIGGLYVERIRKRQDLKNKVLYFWQEETTFITLTREKIEKRHARCGSVQCITRITPATRGGKKQSSPSYKMWWKAATRTIRHWKTWTLLRMNKWLKYVQCYLLFCAFVVLWVFNVCAQESDNLKSQ